MLRISFTGKCDIHLTYINLTLRKNTNIWGKYASIYAGRSNLVVEIVVVVVVVVLIVVEFVEVVDP